MAVARVSWGKALTVQGEFFPEEQVEMVVSFFTILGHMVAVQVDGGMTVIPPVEEQYVLLGDQMYRTQLL